MVESTLKRASNSIGLHSFATGTIEKLMVYRLATAVGLYQSFFYNFDLNQTVEKL